MITAKSYYTSKDHFTCDRTPKRPVKEYELEIYEFGTGFSSIDNVFYPHRNNMVLFSKPGQERFSMGNFECHALHFILHDESISSAFNKIHNVVLVDIATKNLILDYFKKINMNDLLSSYKYIFSILNILEPPRMRMLIDGGNISESIIKVKEYIDMNFRSNISIKTLSEIGNYSLNHMRKKFLDCYGITIKKYISTLRLSHVQKLLVSTNDPVCDIAYSSGFNSQSHMNYMFKLTFGITPLEYKKRTT